MLSTAPWGTPARLGPLPSARLGAMDVAPLLLELYGRIEPLAEEAVDDLDASQLAASPGEGRNTIAWLVWHLTRVQDHHIAELIDEDQLWVTGDWATAHGPRARPAQHGVRPHR